MIGRDQTPTISSDSYSNVAQSCPTQNSEKDTNKKRTSSEISHEKITETGPTLVEDNVLTVPIAQGSSFAPKAASVQVIRWLAFGCCVKSELYTD